jgi:hypothetical protein
VNTSFWCNEVSGLWLDSAYELYLGYYFYSMPLRSSHACLSMNSYDGSCPHCASLFFWVYASCIMFDRIHYDNYTYAYNALCSHSPPCSYHPLAILKGFIWPLHICIQCTLIIFSLSVLFSPPAPAGAPQIVPYLHLSPYFPFRYSFCMRETSGMPFWVWLHLIWYPVPFCQFLETIFFSFFAALWFELWVSSLLGKCSCHLTCSDSPYNFILYCWILPKMFHTWIFLSYFEQRLPPWYFEIS